jgi:hypothetical protein
LGVGGGVGAGVGAGVGSGVGGAGVGGGVGGAGVGAWQSALVTLGKIPELGSCFWQFSVAPGGHGHEKELVGEVSRR